jgi:hypothetical protein
MVEQTDRDGERELDKKSAEAIQIYQKLYPNTSDGSIDDKIRSLERGIEFGWYKDIGNLCLATNEVSDEELELYSRFAGTGFIRASILGRGFKFGFDFERILGSSPRGRNLVSHSIIEASKIGPMANIREGSIVKQSTVYGDSDIWGTVLYNAVIKNVEGSTGGQTVTGRIGNASIANVDGDIVISPRK